MATMAINISNITPVTKGLIQIKDLGKAECIYLMPSSKSNYLATGSIYVAPIPSVALNSTYVPTVLSYYEDPSPFGQYDYTFTPTRNKVKDVEISIVAVKKSSPTTYLE